MSDIIREGHWIEAASRAHKLLSGLSNARDLYLCHEIVKILNYAAEELSCLPAYPNLTFLRVNLGSLHLNCEALQRLLQNSPALTTLELLKGLLLDMPDEQEWNMDPVPPCFMTQLNTIYIGEFHGTLAELN